MMRFVLLASIMLSPAIHVAVAEEAPVATFSLRDYIDREWRNELVFFPVDEKTFERDDVALRGPDDSVLPHQWVAEDLAPAHKPSIAFLATVPTFGEAIYSLTRDTPKRDSDLTARQSGETVTLSNRRIGITLGGQHAAERGPIAGIRLPSGQTVGSGQLSTPSAPTSVKTTLVASGPVFAEAVVEYSFPDYRFWRSRFRVIAGEPVVLIDEQFDLPTGSKYQLQLTSGSNAVHLFYRDNGNRCRTIAAGEVGGDPIFRLEPWPFWWGDELRGNWVTVFDRTKSDTLTLAARDPGVWVTPGRTDWDAAVTFDKDFKATFQLRGFERNWMLAGIPRTEAVREEDIGQAVVPLPQQHLIRHGDFPLDRIKDYSLEWDDRSTPHPRLFTTKAELERFRKHFSADETQLDNLRKKDVFGYSMDEHVAYFLATQDEQLARKLADFALASLQQSVNGFVRQEKLRNSGSCPHHRNRNVYWGAIAADLALSSRVLTPDERTRIKAQLAFLGYTLERPLIISPERGYNANPNMTTMARGMAGIVACTIPHQPQAQQWAELAIAEMELELDQWCGPNGGWLEAPHYATASLDTLISLALAVRDSGFTDIQWEFHPKLRAAVEWLAKISTPPDSRLGGSRHMPAIGNSYLGEPTCLPAWMATIWREKDPVFSRQMQWMWKAQGSPRTPGIGAYPGLQGYNHLLLDDSLATEKPRYASELFPEAGAVLRAHFPSEQETWLHYIQGTMHQHYDFDEGSFVLWGKGQPLCEDFGYYGRAPASDHSRIDDGFYEALGLEGKIQEFAAGEYVDYLRGQRHGWHRQILFAKDKDPLGPNFFLVRDAVLNGRDFDWRLWIAADDSPAVEQNPVRAKGRFGVDLAVYFLAKPAGSISSEQITRTAGTAGWGHDNRTTTQRSLELKRVAADQPVSVVLYPLMADEPTPQFTAIAEGRGVKIVSSSGTDFALLALERFRYEGEGIVFDGKAGMIQVRQDGIRIALPRQGKLTYRGKTVESHTQPERSITKTFR